MDETGHEKQKPLLGDVVSDGALAIIAGSDTASTALAALFFHLLTHPEWHRRVRAEADKSDGTKAPTEDMPALDACMYASG